MLSCEKGRGACADESGGARRFRSAEAASIRHREAHPGRSGFRFLEQPARSPHVRAFPGPTSREALLLQVDDSVAAATAPVPGSQNVAIGDPDEMIAIDFWHREGAAEQPGLGIDFRDEMPSLCGAMEERREPARARPEGHRLKELTDFHAVNHAPD